MKHSTKVAVVALGVLGAGLGTAPAVAAGGWEPGHFEWNETIEDFCDVPGLTVEDVGSSEFRSWSFVRGGSQYGQGQATDTDVYTNLSNGRSATVVEERQDKDLDVTDNGDGTLTVIYHAAGTRTVYDDQGLVIARAAGTATVESVWDHMGTPSNPDDDEPISFTFLKATGHQLDFCGVLVPALT